MSRLGRIVTLSGPSGVGKDTVARAIRQDFPSFYKPINYTTRRCNPGEKPGVDYHFVDKTTFWNMVANNEFVEYAKVHNHWYGTVNQDLRDAVMSGCDTFIVIDNQGALSITKIYPQTIMIYLQYPEGDLATQIAERLKNDPKRKLSNREIVTRIHTAIEEEGQKHLFNYIVTNPQDEPEAAVYAVRNIICNELYPDPNR